MRDRRSSWWSSDNEYSEVENSSTSVGLCNWELIHGRRPSAFITNEYRLRHRDANGNCSECDRVGRRYGLSRARIRAQSLRNSRSNQDWSRLLVPAYRSRDAVLASASGSPESC